MKLFQTVRFLSAKIATSAIFGYPPRCKSRSNDSCSVHPLSEEGALTLLIRNESFITELFQTFSKKLLGSCWTSSRACWIRSALLPMGRSQLKR
jgi:hypothetical protein